MPCTCASTALEDYLYAVAREQAVPKAKSHISSQAGDVQGKNGEYRGCFFGY